MFRPVNNRPKLPASQKKMRKSKTNVFGLIKLKKKKKEKKTLKGPKLKPFKIKSFKSVAAIYFTSKVLSRIIWRETLQISYISLY